MNLDTTTKRVEIVLGEVMTTAECDITASYAMAGAGVFQLAEADLTTNGTTPVVVVAAPPSGRQNQVKEITFFNNDTVTHELTLRINNGGTMRVIARRSIPPNGDFRYVSDLGVAASASAPAILVESGAAEKISAMPSGDTLVTGFSIDPGALLPMEQAGINYGWSLGSIYTFMAFATNYITNPLNAAGGSNNPGQNIRWNGGNGDGTGNGGLATLRGGDGGATSGNGGDVFLTAGSGNGPGVGGNIIIDAGNGATLGNVLLGTIPTVDPTVSAAVWQSNARLVLSGVVIDPVTSTVASGSAVTLTTGTAADVTTISVPAGNWTITGAVYFTGNAATTVTLVQGSVGTAANTLDTTLGQFDTEYLAGATLTVLGADPALLGFSTDVTLGSTTTYRLDAQATFAINTLSAYGTIRAVPRA